MQAPKHELFMLNWEIFDLNKKLKTFANVYSVIDLWTVDCLSQLIATVDAIMTGTSFKPYGDWDKKDEKIFQGYSFHHSINCKQCGRAVKIAKPTLLKHLKECNSTAEECASEKRFIKECLEITNMGVPIKTKPGNETRAATLGGSQQNRSNTKIPETDEPYKKKTRRGRRGRGTQRSTAPSPTSRSKSGTSAQSNSTVSSKQNGPKQVDKPKKLNDHNFKKEFTATKKGTENGKVPKFLLQSEPGPSKRNTSAQSNSSKTTNTASLKQQKHEIHRPNRARDGEYVSKGSIPDDKIELTKMVKKFISNVTPQTILKLGDSYRRELSNSPAHDNVVKTLEGLFETSYPKAKAYQFGSRITRLGNETSDLDIYLDLEGNYDGSKKYSKDKLKWCVLLTKEYLERSDQWSRLDPVTSARTPIPILRAWNKKEKIDCDISFTHGLSHCNTQLIQYLFDLQPVCYYVALYANEWSRNFSLDGLNTYTLVLLTVFYFQERNLLPDIRDLQISCKDPMFITHWQANFERKSLEELKIPQIPEAEAEKHIVKFFNFYGSGFSFATRMVCPLLGWAPLKEDFDPFNYEMIPGQMENLQIYLKDDLSHANDLMLFMNPMVVQDPFELNHNVAEAVSQADIDRFRKLCTLTATLLKETTGEPVPSKRDTSAQSNSSKTTIASEQKLPNLTNKTTNPASVKQQKHDEPKRKIHRPNRARDGEYVTKGSIPDNKIELTKKTKKFITNVTPQTTLKFGDSYRKELSNSPAHDNVVKTLEGLFKTSYPKAKAYPFGSRITGLGKETSDLDIYLDLEGNYDGSKKYSKDKLKWCVLLTEEYLKRSDQWSRLDPVTSARTPILRAWNKKEKIDCDISFTHGLSHCNTKLIQYLFDLQPVCYYVAVYAKEWSRNFSMDGLNTYTLVLLTVFYFQKHNLLPCIHGLQKSCKDPMFITHWQANFERKSLEELKIPQIPEAEAEKHIVKFFSFYGLRFCFETRVVCPLLGWAPQKEDFDPFDCEIPLEMENLQKYYSKIDMKQAHPVNDLLSYMKPMVVQDPFELNHNVAKGVSPADVDRFRKLCALTATLLDEVLNETA